MKALEVTLTDGNRRALDAHYLNTASNSAATRERDGESAEDEDCVCPMQHFLHTGVFSDQAVDEQNDIRSQSIRLRVQAAQQTAETDAVQRAITSRAHLLTDNELSETLVTKSTRRRRVTAQISLLYPDNLLAWSYARKIALDVCLGYNLRIQVRRIICSCGHL